MSTGDLAIRSSNHLQRATIGRFEIQSWLSMSRLLAGIYFVLALAVTLVLCLLMPPLMNPDEGAHLRRADQLSHGQIIGQKEDDRHAGGVTDRAIDEVNQAFSSIPAQLDHRVTKDMYDKAGQARWTDGKIFVGFANTVVYPPVLYLPSALGLKLGRRFHLDVLRTLELARALSATTAVVLGTAAIAFSGAAAPWLFAVLTLPTSLSLSATSGQEGGLNACAALACALILTCWSARRNTTATFYAACVALILASSARPTLVVLVLPLLFVSNVEWKNRVAGAALVFLAAVAWIAISSPAYIHPRIGLDFSIDPKDFGTGRQLQYIVTHPIEFMKVFAQTIRFFKYNFFEAYVGVLGWYDTFVPSWYVNWAAVVLAVSLVATVPADTRKGQAWVSASTIAALVACFVATLVAQYLAWTPIGYDTILGVQGRYFTAPSLFAGLLLPFVAVPSGVKRTLAAVPVLFAIGVTVPVTMHAIVVRYYLT